MTGCTTCELGLDHCHAPIIEFTDGTYECTEGCGGPRAIHDDVLWADEKADDERALPLAPAA